MSRWLLNVGQFLENLDNQAKDVVEERLIGDNSRYYGAEIIGENIDNILVSRGLLSTNDIHEKDENDADRNEEDIKVEKVEEELFTENNENVHDVVTGKEEKELQYSSIDLSNESLGENRREIQSGENFDESKQTSASLSETEIVTLEPNLQITNESDAVVETERSETVTSTNNQALNEVSDKEKELNATSDNLVTPARQERESERDLVPLNTPYHTPAQFPPSSEGRSNVADDLKMKQLEYEKQEILKESRKLKRHIISLNGQLDSTEKEMFALRKELENAASLMEKDRARHKEILEKANSKYSNDLNEMKVQSQQSSMEIQAKYDLQIREIKEEFNSLEQRRRQEGGDYSKDLEEAIKREQTLQSQYDLILDEREVLLQQISTLQSQQHALGIRLEALSSSAEMAAAREHDAERRLDEALELHTRQMIQRQTREAELERTVAELGSALLSSQNVSNNRSIGNTLYVSSNTSDQTTGDATSQEDPQQQYQIALQTLEGDVSTLRSLLAHEQEKYNALQNEVRHINEIRTEEALVATERHRLQEGTIETLNGQCSQLKAQLQNKENDFLSASVQPQQILLHQEEDRNQVRTLSEEVLAQREKISTYSSEVSALRTRLNVALHRATVAEAVAEQSITRREVDNGSNTTYGIPRRRKDKESEFPSMRKALMFDNINDSGSTTIGQIMDFFDSKIIKGWRMIRSSPLVRLLFKHGHHNTHPFLQIRPNVVDVQAETTNLTKTGN